MDDLLTQLAVCIERGKANKQMPYPLDMQGQDGASEITKCLLDSGVPSHEILDKALITGMHTSAGNSNAEKHISPTC